MIGYMPMPADFPHRDLFYAGRPVHRKYDDFWCRHPVMEPGRRAKIFAPFDALKGFSDAVNSKKTEYIEKRELNEEAKAELNRRLLILQNATKNLRLAKQNRVAISVEYYVPCSDVSHDAYGCRGRCKKASGICYGVDFSITESILIDGLRIPLSDLLSVESETGLFDSGRPD
ncbi:MAG: hypothetical protein IJV40_08190 [Oscillospiraceae bacterium]|nr:hypothetical protein [Oscillospiraceae bacterium]